MTSPLTDQQLGNAETAITAYQQHPDIGFACCSAHPAADTAATLLAEVRRLRDRVNELETYAYGCDAEGCVIPHSSWCEDAKKTAAANNGCTCGQPWTGHPQPHAMHCWTVNPPRAEVEEMRKRIAELIQQRDQIAMDTVKALATADDEASADGDAQPETGTRPCGHDDYHDPHEWADRPGMWCPGISYADDEPAVPTVVETGQ